MNRPEAHAASSLGRRPSAPASSGNQGHRPDGGAGPSGDGARRALHVLGGVPRGHARVPGDKSLSHRVLLLAGLASGRSVVEGLLGSGDVAATAAALRQLGVAIERRGDQPGRASFVVDGVGLEGLREAAGVLDCGRSGTTMSLLAGVLAGRPFTSLCSGDPQLLRRPMQRVLRPLRAMGAQVLGRQGDERAPFAIRGGNLQGRSVTLEQPSAQAKSAVLLAGLQASGRTRLREPAPSRDHTERLLAALGVPVTHDAEGGVAVEQLRKPWAPFGFSAPGDPSSAAFLLAAAACTPGGEVEARDVSLNPGRIGLLHVLRRAGAEVDWQVVDHRLGEPVGHVRVAAPRDRLRPVLVAGAEIASLIDEIPVLAVVLAHAGGRSEIADAAALRGKESDRIRSTVQGLQALGATVEEQPEGMILHGGGLRPRRPGEERRRVDPGGDHRLAMAFAIAGLPQGIPIEVADIEVADDSFPGFADALRSVGVIARGDAAVGRGA